MVTFEYVVWKGINDKKKDIDALVAYCKKIPSKVNLIEYNAIEEDGFVQADEAAVLITKENWKEITSWLISGTVVVKILMPHAVSWPIRAVIRNSSSTPIGQWSLCFASEE